VTDLALITSEEAEAIHRRIMADYPAEPIGVRDAHGLAGALARPTWYAQYQQADVARQAAALLCGLVMAHAFANGNKRTAWEITKVLLLDVGYHIAAPHQAILDLVYGIDNEGRTVEEVAAWFREHLRAPAEEGRHGQ
jgi:death-on-curing protein